MSSEVSAKLQMMLWWIASIATSVLCCSLLFVLFANYLVDVKRSVMASEERIASIEERSERILLELQMLRKQTLISAPNKPQVDGAVAPVAEEGNAVPAGQASGGVEVPALDQQPQVQGGEAANAVKKDDADKTAAPASGLAVPADNKK